MANNCRKIAEEIWATMVLLIGFGQASTSPSLVHRRHCHLPHLRHLAQPRFAEALPPGVVEQHPMFLACPDGVDLQQARALKVEDQTTGFAGTTDQHLLRGGLARVEMVMAAHPLMDVLAQTVD